MEALAPGGELEEVDLLLALAADGEHLAVGELLPAHRLDAVRGELHPVAQLAGALGPAARLDLKRKASYKFRGCSEFMMSMYMSEIIISYFIGNLFDCT